MPLRNFLNSVFLLLVVMALFAVLELAAPLFARDARKRGRAGANFGLTAVTFLSNWALTAVPALIGLAREPHGLLARSSLPGPVILLISVVALDFSTYLMHRSMHAIPVLWRVHAVHHSDPFLDVTTSFRQHPLEGIWRFAFVLGPVWLLGVPASGVVVYRMISAIQALFEHANIRLPAAIDRSISWFWVTPNMHKVHHSRLRAENDTNYGNLFSLYDRLLGTFTRSERAYGVSYGLETADEERVKSLVALLSRPFSSAGIRSRS